MDFVIAVDGPAASGKGTVASRLAAHFGLPYLDTGLLYRAVGYNACAAALQRGGRGRCWPDGWPPTCSTIPDTARRRPARRPAGSPPTPACARPCSSLQRDFADQPGGAVLDGRDIGTVIARRPPAKLFVTAAPEVRAERRWKQLVGQGETIAFDDVLADIRRRDARDCGRADAPLAGAPDAVLLDTTEMTISAGRRCGPPHRRGGARRRGLPRQSQSHRALPSTAAGTLRALKAPPVGPNILDLNPERSPRARMAVARSSFET